MASSGRTYPTAHLISPPMWSRFMPPLALARLEAYLRRAGIAVRSYDWNLDFHEQVELRFTSSVFRKFAGKRTIVGNELPQFPQLRTGRVIDAFLRGGANRPSELELVMDQRLLDFVDRRMERATSEESFRDGDVYGLSALTTSQIPALILIAKRIRERFPRAGIIAGGTGFQFIPVDRLGALADAMGIDFVVQGPGERPTHELCLERAGLPPDPSLGDTWDEPELPFFDYSSFELKNYEMGFPYMISRVCYWDKCSYCTRPPALFRRASLNLSDVVVDLAQHQQQEGLEYITFIDDAISGAKLGALGKRMLEHGLKIKWSAQTRPDDLLRRVDWSQLEEAGLTVVYTAMETASQRISDLMDRGAKTADFEGYVRSIAEAGIVVNINVLVGFPGVRREDAEQTIAMVERLDDCLGSICVNDFVLQRDSPAYRDPVKYGVTPLPHELTFPFDCQVPFEYAERAEEQWALRAEVCERLHEFQRRRKQRRSWSAG